MKYTLVVKEILSKSLVIEAESEEAAVDTVRSLYRDTDIVLYPEDFEYATIIDSEGRENEI